MKLRLTKYFSFEMAHALADYDGKCHNIHGHSYKLQVTIEGEPSGDLNSPKVGMVVDFSEIKRIVNACVVEPFDHALVLPHNSPYPPIEGTKLIVTDFQPTTENLLVHFASLLQGKFPPQVRLCSLKLFETENSCAELIL